MTYAAAYDLAGPNLPVTAAMTPTLLDAWFLQPYLPVATSTFGTWAMQQLGYVPPPLPTPGSSYTPPTTGQLWPRSFPGLSTGQQSGGGSGGVGPITLVGTASSDTLTGPTPGSITVSTDASAAIDDWFLVGAVSRYQALATPSGYTRVAFVQMTTDILDPATSAGYVYYVYLFAKKLTAAGAQSLTITVGDSGMASDNSDLLEAVGATYRGVGTPVLFGTDTVTTSDTPSISGTVVDGSLLWMQVRQAGSGFVSTCNEATLTPVGSGIKTKVSTETVSAGSLARTFTNTADEILIGINLPD